MSFEETLKKLKSSKEFKEFIKENKKAFLFAAFFVLNEKLEIESTQFDYCIDDKKPKVMTFILNDEIRTEADKFVSKEHKIEKLNENIKIDIPELIRIIKKEIGKKCPDISKIIAILQTTENAQVWNVIVMSSSFQIFKMNIDCFSGKVLKTEEKNVMDFVNVRNKKDK